MKKTKEDIVLGTIKYICIAALLIVVLFPIIWLVAGSFVAGISIWWIPMGSARPIWCPARE